MPREGVDKVVDHAICMKTSPRLHIHTFYVMKPRDVVCLFGKKSKNCDHCFVNHALEITFSSWSVTMLLWVEQL